MKPRPAHIPRIAVILLSLGRRPRMPGHIPRNCSNNSSSLICTTGNCYGEHGSPKAPSSSTAWQKTQKSVRGILGSSGNSVPDPSLPPSAFPSALHLYTSQPPPPPPVHPFKALDSYRSQHPSNAARTRIRTTGRTRPLPRLPYYLRVLAQPFRQSKPGLRERAFF